MFDITGKTLKPVTEARSSEEREHWWNALVEAGRAKKAVGSLQRSLSSTEIEVLARNTFEEIKVRAVQAGFSLPTEFLLRLIGELSGMGPLLELIARADVEDIAINLGHIYVYTTTSGWEYSGPASEGIGDALRVMIDRRTARPHARLSDRGCHAAGDGAIGRGDGAQKGCAHQLHHATRFSVWRHHYFAYLELPHGFGSDTGQPGDVVPETPPARAAAAL
jgi:hypothetical protein